MQKYDLENRIKELELELSNLKSTMIASEQVTNIALKKSDAKFLNLANYIPAHIAYVNIETLQYEYVNDLFEKSFGIPREKIIGSHIKNVIGEENFKFALQYINEVKSGKSASYENTFNLTSGKRWIQVNYFPVFDVANKVIGIALVSYDTTEKKQAEEKSRLHEEKYRLLAESSPEMIYLIDKEGFIQYINQAASSSFHQKAEQLIGKHLTEIYPINIANSHLAAINEIFKNKQKISKEIEEEFPMGKIWIDVCLSPLINESGEVIAVLGLSNNITERKQAELALQESEERFQLLFNKAPLGYQSLDYDGNFIEVNQAWLDTLGFIRKEVIGKWFGDFLSPAYQDGFRKRFPIFKAQGYIHSEFEMVHKNGSILFIAFEGRIGYDTNGEFKQTHCILQDITEQKQAELALKENEIKLRQLNVDKDRFISILGHDLKNPFNNILGFSEILIDEIDSLNKDKITDIAKYINKSAQTTNKLLDDILIWARTQQGKIPFKPQILSFADICKDIISTLNPYANAKKITLNFSITDRINIFADIDMLKTVLRNLVSNAIKFTSIGGTINITARKIYSNITISVSDNGIGIAPDNLAKLFEISEVISTKGTAGETGTGLGLLLCKEFVEKHDGKIWVESEVGKGSDFKFTLPIFTESAVAKNN